MKKNKLPRGYAEYYEDLKEYRGLSEEDQQYIETFYHEMYNDGVSFKERDELILTSPDMIKEARKNHNSIKRDAYRVAKKKGIMSYNGETEDGVIYDPVDLSRPEPEPEWKKAYIIGGFKAAGKFIVNRAIEELNISESDDEKAEVLLYMLLCFREIKLEYRKEKREKRKNEKA